MSRYLLMLLLIVATGCQKSTSTSNSSGKSTTSQAELVDVSLGLNWLPEVEHGGYYAALVHGYFADEGLRVTIEKGGPKVPLILNVADGRVDFGVDNADKLLLARAQQADVVAVMSPIQDSPRCIMVHKKTGVSRLEDLAKVESFTLAMNAGQPFAQFLRKKVKLDNVQVVQYGGNVAQFLEQTNFGQQAYVFSEPFQAESQKADPVCLMLSDIGFNTYTSMLVTRRDNIKNRSDIVKKMTRASIRGWKKYLAEPDETNKYIHGLNTEMGMDILSFGVKVVKPLCTPEGFDEKGFGTMSSSRWDTLAAQMVEAESLKPDAVKAADAYMLEFLDTK